LVEGRNVRIEYRFARNAHDRMPDLANELVSQHASVIMASTIGAALAAAAATTTIPIVFRSGADAVQSHLVASFNQPGRNITGINDFGVDHRAEAARSLERHAACGLTLCIAPLSEPPGITGRAMQALGASVFRLVGRSRSVHRRQALARIMVKGANQKRGSEPGLALIMRR
jgi:hypothetical protein